MGPMMLLHPRGCASRAWRRRYASALARQELRFLSASRLSISQGPSEPPLLPHTIPDHFASIVSKYGDRPAVMSRTPSTKPTTVRYPPTSANPESRSTSWDFLCPLPSTTITLSYLDLDVLSSTLATNLRSLGVRKGDRVAVSLGNTPAFATLTYAIFKLGAILVPLNPAFTTTQVAAALNHLDARVLVIGAVTDLPYKPCAGRSNLPLLQALVPDLQKRHRKGIQSPLVPCLRDIILVDNTLFHPSVTLPPDLNALTPLEDLTHTSSSSTTTTITPDAPLRPSDTINIQFTSGTTSTPKAAQLSHTTILNNGHLIAQRMRLTPNDRIVCPPPLFHCFGSVLGYMATATTGAALLLPSPAFDPVATLGMCAGERATGLYGVATMFRAVLDVLAQQQKLLTSPPFPNDRQGNGDPERPFLTERQIDALPKHLRTGIAAGSSVPSAMMTRIFENLGMEELVICYGMTETGPVSCMTSPDDSLERRVGSVGRAMPHTRVKVVDPGDRSRILPRGERGEFAASGYLCMEGYWGDEARTGEVRVWEADEPLSIDEIGGEGDGEKGRVWVYSGDEALMDEDGYVEITGRIKDLIIRGGENIHPLEIENCLFQHELIAEASVVGVPDERYGEVVGAFVIVREGVRVEGVDGQSVREVGGGEMREEKVLTADEIREWVRGRLSGHLVPRYVFRVDEYPKTASGKIQKFKLRDMAREMVFGKQGQSS